MSENTATQLVRSYLLIPNRPWRVIFDIEKLSSTDPKGVLSSFIEEELRAVAGDHCWESFSQYFEGTRPLIVDSGVCSSEDHFRSFCKWLEDKPEIEVKGCSEEYINLSVEGRGLNLNLKGGGYFNVAIRIQNSSETQEAFQMIFDTFSDFEFKKRLRVTNYSAEIGKRRVTRYEKLLEAHKRIVPTIEHLVRETPLTEPPQLCVLGSTPEELAREEMSRRLQRLNEASLVFRQGKWKP